MPPEGNEGNQGKQGNQANQGNQGKGKAGNRRAGPLAVRMSRIRAPWPGRVAGHYPGTTTLEA